MGDFDDQAEVKVPQIGVLAPYDASKDYYFEKSKKVELISDTDGAAIYYTMDGSTPNRQAQLYSEPILLQQDAIIKAIAYNDELNPSTVFEKSYFQSFLLELKEGYPKIRVEERETPYGNADCSMMFDQLIGTETYSDGKWTGLKDDFSIRMDLGEIRKVNKVSVGALTDTGVWIFPPEGITISGGTSESTLKMLAQRDIPELEGDEKRVVRYNFDTKGASVKYLKVDIKNYGVAPSWHGAGKGQKMWLFVDEITLN